MDRVEVPEMTEIVPDGFPQTPVSRQMTPVLPASANKRASQISKEAPLSSSRARSVEHGLQQEDSGMSELNHISPIEEKQNGVRSNSRQVTFKLGSNQNGDMMPLDSEPGSNVSMKKQKGYPSLLSSWVRIVP